MDLQTSTPITETVTKWLTAIWGMTAAWLTVHIDSIAGICQGFVEIGRALLVAGSLVLMWRQLKQRPKKDNVAKFEDAENPTNKGKCC